MFRTEQIHVHVRSASLSFISEGGQSEAQKARPLIAKILKTRDNSPRRLVRVWGVGGDSAGNTLAGARKKRAEGALQGGRGRPLSGVWRRCGSGSAAAMLGWAWIRVHRSECFAGLDRSANRNAPSHEQNRHRAGDGSARTARCLAQGRPPSPAAARRWSRARRQISGARPQWR